MGKEYGVEVVTEYYITQNGIRLGKPYVYNNETIATDYADYQNLMTPRPDWVKWHKVRKGNRMTVHQQQVRDHLNDEQFGELSKTIEDMSRAYNQQDAKSGFWEKSRVLLIEDGKDLEYVTDMIVLSCIS